MKHTIRRTYGRLFVALVLITGLCLIADGLRAGATSAPRINNAERQPESVDDSLMKAIDAAGIARVSSPAQSFQARLAAADGSSGDRFGWSVALSGNTALVGAYLRLTGTFRTGAAYIFQRTGPTWSLQATLLPDSGFNKNFGSSVALSGDTAVIGNPNNNDSTGAVYVFQRNGTTWQKQAKLESGQPFFGARVAISVDTIVVGDDLAVSPGLGQTGAAYVYRFNGSTWELESSLLGSDSLHADHFGVGLAISGDTLIVGAYGDDTNGGGTDAGSAFIFQRSGTTWTEKSHLIPADSAAGDLYGWSVGISGDTAIASAYYDDTLGAANAGSIYVYQRNGATWSQQTKLTATEPQAGETLGYSTAINGDTIVAGAQLYDLPAIQNAGAAHIFQRANGVWGGGVRVTTDNAKLNDAFGTSVALSDNTFTVGSPFGDAIPVNSRGTSHVYVTRPGHRQVGDFDGDTLTDLSVFRPSDNTWYARQSTNGATLATQFGATGDIPAPGDYDGDGKTDLAVFRPSSGTWYALNSSNHIVRARQFGLSGDVPVPGDYDGNGLTEIAVFRPSTGIWYINLGSFTGNFRAQAFGANGDKPVAGDYDGDGKWDVAVMRPSDNTWHIYQSLTNTVRSEQWGANGDVAVPGDYDGDTKKDIAVYRPAEGGWYIQQSTLKLFRGQSWGAAGDVPAQGDYNADGKTDVAVFRPSTGTWYILQSGSNVLRAEQWGTAGDVPVPSALNP